MSNRPPLQAHRCPVPLETAGLDRSAFDYADCFEIDVADHDQRTAEQFTRTALEGSPTAVRWTVLAAWSGLLRFRLGPRPSPAHVLGMPIVLSEPGILRLDGRGPLLRGVVTVRRLEPRRVALTTHISFTRRGPARVAWAVAAPLHRLLAGYLLEHAAAAASGLGASR